MIRIEVSTPQKLKPTPLSPLSGFITFPYDSDIIRYIQNLGTRVYIPEKKTWEVPLTLIPKICNDLENYAIEICGAMVKEVDIAKQLPADFQFKTKPFTHQIEGVLYGYNHDTFLLGDEQGLGKTKQIIDLAVLRKRSNGLKRCLIICGVNGLKYNWLEEIEKHSNEQAWILGTRYTKRPPIKMREGTAEDKLADLNNLPDCFFLITNIETLRLMSYKDKKTHKTIFPIAEKIKELCSRGEIGMIVFDEAHKAKNPTSLQGQALLSLTTAKYRIPLSGTFLMNNPLDLYVPLKWTGYETHDFYNYKQHYCVFGGYDAKEIVGYKNLDELRAIMSRVMLRRTKDEVLDLPPKMYNVEYVDMLKEQEDLYEQVKWAIKQDVDKVKLNPDPLSILIRLRQATGYPGILSSTVTESAKMNRMVEIVEELVESGQKVVVFSQWETMVMVAKKKLAKYNPAIIVGETKTDERIKEVERFQNDPKCSVIIGTIGAMGTGFTLHAASEVIFLDEPWNRALKDQAEDRVHRIGTKGTVRITTLICKDTIDERIHEIVYKKGKMADMLLDGKMTAENRSEIVDYLLS